MTGTVHFETLRPELVIDNESFHQMRNLGSAPIRLFTLTVALKGEWDFLVLLRVNGGE